MIAPASRGGRGGIPIAAQLAMLLGFTLASAVLLAILIFVVVPPRPPQEFQIKDVVGALSGGPLRGDGFEFVRTRERDNPKQSDSVLYHPSRLRGDVAELMRMPLERVRFYRLAPGRFAGYSGSGLPRLGGDPSEQTVTRFLGGFVAAFRGDDGQWTVVRPAPLGLLEPSVLRIVAWSLGCLLMIFPAAWWFAQRINRPVHHFAAAAQRLRRDPKAAPVPLEGPSELRAAAAEFNEMQVALQRYVDDRTAMLAAISHDLRTPLSRLRFKMENGLPNRDAMLSDLAQMEQMIASILDSMRQDAQGQPGRMLDLRSLLECVTDDAASAGGDAAIADGEPLYVHGDICALRRLFANLVQNALRYGRTARVEARRFGDVAQIEVRDDGPGLPERELEAVFRPFYRGDAARNMDKTNPQTGVGLGLSICRTIARAHGGDVILSRGEPGLVARVTLPLLAEGQPIAAG